MCCSGKFFTLIRKKASVVRVSECSYRAMSTRQIYIACKKWRLTDLFHSQFLRQCHFLFVTIQNALEANCYRVVVTD